MMISANSRKQFHTIMTSKIIAADTRTGFAGNGGKKPRSTVFRQSNGQAAHVGDHHADRRISEPNERGDDLIMNGEAAVSRAVPLYQDFDLPRGPFRIGRDETPDLNNVTAGEKVVGLIGGMGPEATVDFYSKLLQKTGATSDQDHLHVIINNNPKVPDRQRSIAGTGPSSAPALVETALALEKSGADFLVMACNTAHAYEEDIVKAASIPFVSILSENVAASLRLIPNLKSVGLLAASGCVAAELYQSRSEKAGVRCVVPTLTEQKHLMNLIYRVKSGDKAPDIRTQMAQLAEKLVERGAAELILAACTEVPLALRNDDISKPLLDCTATLVDATIAFAKGGRGNHLGGVWPNNPKHASA